MKRLLYKMSKILPDSMYLKIMYFRNMKKKLNLKQPKTYNEKIQWLKINDRNPIYTSLVDKYEVRNYVEEKIGKQYLIPLLGVWTNVDDIDISRLPNQFVLKTNHDSGGVRICKSKDKFDFAEAKSFLNKRMKENYYYLLREWPYKNVKKRIIAEEYLNDLDNVDLADYKFFCFNGKVKFLFVATERHSKEETKFDFFDSEFNHLEIQNGHPNSDKKLKKPFNFDEMITLAERLSEDIKHVRVDLYSVNNKIYFGELTFHHFSGVVPFKPEKWDYEFGEMLDIK